MERGQPTRFLNYFPLLSIIMIAVDRSRIPCPPVLVSTDANSLGAKETAKAIAYATGALSKAPKYGAYAHDQVRQSLINLFYGKCAYCEESTNVTSGRDVEHFRPKGRINPGTGKKAITPGYYWLAAAWDNLLLSCTACNRSQRQLLRDKNGDFVFDKKATGKQDLFPIRDGEENRLRDHTRAISLEEPYRLLLNPCVDTPEEHLRFDGEGNVLPREIDGVLSEKARWSIEAYALKRVTLVEARKARYLELVNCRANIKLIVRLMEAAGAAEKDDIAQAIREYEVKITTGLGGKQHFTGMLLQLTEPWLLELAVIKTRFFNMFGQPV